SWMGKAPTPEIDETTKGTKEHEGRQGLTLFSSVILSPSVGRTDLPGMFRPATSCLGSSRESSPKSRDTACESEASPEILRRNRASERQFYLRVPSCPYWFHFRSVFLRGAVCQNQ